MTVAEPQSGGRNEANRLAMTLPPLRGSRHEDNPHCGLTPAAICWHRFAIQQPFQTDHHLTTAPYVRASTRLALASDHVPRV